MRCVILTGQHKWERVEGKVRRRGRRKNVAPLLSLIRWQWIWAEPPVPRRCVPQRQMQLSAECHFLIRALTDLRESGVCVWVCVRQIHFFSHPETKKKTVGKVKSGSFFFSKKHFLCHTLFKTVLTSLPLLLPLIFSLCPPRFLTPQHHN